MHSIDWQWSRDDPISSGNASHEIGEVQKPKRSRSSSVSSFVPYYGYLREYDCRYTRPAHEFSTSGLTPRGYGSLSDSVDLLDPWS